MDTCDEPRPDQAREILAHATGEFGFCAGCPTAVRRTSLEAGWRHVAACQHCPALIEELPGSKIWADDLGFGACVKGELWRGPDGQVHERPAVLHTPLVMVT